MLNDYEDKLETLANTFVVYGKDDRKTCFDCLDKRNQDELKVEYLKVQDPADIYNITEGINEKLDINPGLLIATGKLTDDIKTLIQQEFNSWIEALIEDDLSDAYLEALRDKDYIIAGYKADYCQDDYWSAA